LKTIHKQKLGEGTEKKFSAPPGAVVLTVQYVLDTLCVWYIVDPDLAPTHLYTLNIYGTGWELPDNPGKYITTVIDSKGYVWHIFET
jgi:hypothetical protein